ncbi:glycosyltransferase family A protein [Zafaria sp. Z1313]|uniref:glycosyltransferase n=1 Tax=unclassified Zafaria TaxID=2828765 RepID=UPI002E75ACB2|nr:glycosyltransferase family A protein [Zafaria sp. J156]MEE1621906.1 glycosyltransferase family A protein [Zafaria sp. J156]
MSGRRPDAARVDPGGGAAAPGPPGIRHVAVVVPVKDEAELLPACLRRLAAAMDRFDATGDGRGSTLVLALDSCTDASRAIAAQASRRDRRIGFLAGAFGGVGPARAAGVERALGRIGAVVPERIWIACTDADTLVPVDWVLRQAALADAGADAVLGTVEPDPADTEQRLLAAWHAQHDLADGHPHVHGANLGIRASAYRLVGGFAPVEYNEDVLLVAALRAAGRQVLSSGDLRALTSGRLVGRAAQGFAAYLRELGGTLSPGTASVAAQLANNPRASALGEPDSAV